MNGRNETDVMKGRREGWECVMAGVPKCREWNAGSEEQFALSGGLWVGLRAEGACAMAALPQTHGHNDGRWKPAGISGGLREWMPAMLALG